MTSSVAGLTLSNAGPCPFTHAPLMNKPEWSVMSVFLMWMVDMVKGASQERTKVVGSSRSREPPEDSGTGAIRRAHYATRP